MQSGTICEPVVVDPGRLVRVEHVGQPAGAPVPDRFAHFHDVAELLWFDSVEGTLISEDGHYVLDGGTAVLLPPMRHHDFVLAAAARSWVLVHIDPALLGGPAGDARLPASDKCHVVRFDADDRNRMAILFGWLLALQQAGQAQRTAIVPLLALVMTAIMAADPVTPVAAAVSADGLSRLRPALDTVLRNPAAALTLDAAAAACHLSSAYFSRRFKALLGMNYSDYVRLCRLRLAAQRLLTSSDRVGAIAHESGFGTAAHFSAQFHKRYGMSPRQYRSGAARSIGRESVN